MRIWQFYIIWTTRNGQKLWEGPFNSEEVAAGKLDRITEARANNSGKVLRDSQEVTAE